MLIVFYSWIFLGLIGSIYHAVDMHIETSNVYNSNRISFCIVDLIFIAIFAIGGYFTFGVALCKFCKGKIALKSFFKSLNKVFWKILDYDIISFEIKKKVV